MGWDDPVVRSLADVFGPSMGLHNGSVSRMVDPMPATEVIEYTHRLSNLDSTSIKNLWYNEATERMTVEFQAGSGIYSYDGVSPDLWNNLTNAESVGGYFGRVFRKPGETWPGVKHSGRIRYAKVTRTEPILESDVDEIKVARLTSGRGKVHQISFTYSGSAVLDVRAESLDAALDLFREHFASLGIPVEVQGVYMDLTPGKK